MTPPTGPETSSAHEPAGALAGIRVVEFAQNVAVPTCGRILAAMGADVIKVEPPAGDAARTMGPFPGTTEARTYVTANPGKRSIVLDLTDDSTWPARDALLASADVVLCAFKGPDLVRFGLTYEHTASLNPRVIYLEHRALGSVGPDAEEGGYDVLVQGLSGLSFVTSRAEAGQPISVRPAYSDMSTGLSSTAAVLGALFHRERTGEGQRVRTSLLGTAHWLALPTNGRFPDQEAEALAEFEEDLELIRSTGGSFADQRALYEARVLPAGGAFDFCFRHFQTQDSMMSVGALSPQLIAKFFVTIGIESPFGRLEYRGHEWNALINEIEDLMRTDTTASWVARLRATGIPSSPYYLPHEAMRDPGAIANGFVEEIVHPIVGRVRTSAAPLQMERSPVRTSGPSPTLGQHTDEILGELGLGPTTD